MKFKIFVTAVVIFLSNFLSVQAQNQPCGCADKKDLLNLLNISQRAIQELNFQLELLTARESVNGNTELYSREILTRLLETIDTALDDVRGRGDARYDFFEMNLRDCSLKEKNPTQNECLRQINKSLFDVYKRACDQTKNLPYNESPYRETKQVIQHEILAYQEMQNFILRMLKALPKNCRPNNWFGYVVYQKVKTSTSNRTIPAQTGISRPSPGITITNGGNEIQVVKNTYIGTIFVEEGKMSSARGYAEFSLNNTKTTTGRIYCSKNKPDENLVETKGQKSNLSGESSDGKATFRLDVNPEKAKYHIYMGFFAVNATGQLSNFGQSSVSCGLKPFSYNNPLTNRLDGPGYYSANGEIEESPDYLEGNKTEKPSAENQSSTQGNISTTQTSEIQVRWMLRRLPQK